MSESTQNGGLRRPGYPQASPARARAVTKVTLRAMPCKVREVPRLAAAALAAVIPGQMRTGTPAAWQASSAPFARPNIDGSSPEPDHPFARQRRRADQPFSLAGEQLGIARDRPRPA